MGGVNLIALNKKKLQQFMYELELVIWSIPRSSVHCTESSTG